MTRTERTYYLVASLYNASWSGIGPIYALFLIERGLDLFQASMVLATFLVTAFLFEVPTGAVADVFGRKVSFLLSCVVRAGAFGLYSFADSFAEFLFAEFIDAIGTTLATGALDAWAVDGMRAEGDDTPRHRFFARAQFLTRALMIVFGVLGGYLAGYGLHWPWLLGVTLFLTTAILGWVLMVDRPPTRAEAAARLGIVATVGAGWTEVRTHTVMRALCLVTMTSAFAWMPVIHTWQLHLNSISAQDYWVFGWVWALINLAAMAGSAIVPWLLDLPRERVLALTTAMRAVVIGAAALSPQVAPVVLGLLLFELGGGVSEPVLQAWMNEHAEAERRATVLSVRQMSFTLGGAVGLCILGLTARDVGVPAAWTLAALVLTGTSIGYLGLGRIAARHAARELRGQSSTH